jgi:hypothetical protein
MTYLLLLQPLTKMNNSSVSTQPQLIGYTLKTTPTQKAPTAQAGLIDQPELSCN